MADKRFYWLKLHRDFFKRHDIRIIEEMPNGKDYILFYLKLLLESVDHEGSLRFSDTIPYSESMLSVVTNTNVDIVRSAMKIFIELGMISILDDKTIYMDEVDKMIGSETKWAEKKRIQRAKEDNVPKLSSNCPIEKEIEIEIEKELDKEKISLAHSGGETAAQKAAKTVDAKKKFEIFWSAYPRKMGKGKAEAKFLSIKPSDELFETMMYALKKCKSSEQWTRDGGMFIPYPSTWLHQRRWEDEDLIEVENDGGGRQNIFARLQEEERRRNGYYDAR